MSTIGKYLFLPIIGIFIFHVTMQARQLPQSGDDYRLKNIIEVEGRQGIAVDANFYYVSGSKALFKYTKEGDLVAKNENPFEGLAKEANHFGDIDVYDGLIVTGAEWFDSGNVRNIQIAVYDASDLSYKYSIDFGQTDQPEVCGVAVDPENDVAWMADWTEGKFLYKYDLSNQKYLRKIQLTPAPRWQQGVFCADGKILISADDGDANLNEPDNIYIADLKDDTKAVCVSKFRSMTDFIRTGEIEGLAIDPENNDLLVLNNRGAIICKGMPTGFYPGYEREIHEVYIYERVK